MSAPSMIAIIPARGGSKGLPRKNVLELAGRPLIAWTITAARGAKCVGRVVLSSDNDEIIDVAREYNCEVPFKRPPELATDEASTMDVLRHALANLPGFDFVALLQPTSPLRTADDIDAAFETMRAAAAPACVSVTTAAESPYWMYQFGPDQRLGKVLETPSGITRRQDLPAAYSLNGAVYIAQTAWLLRNGSFLSPETVGYVMPRERSCDIDTPEDWRALEYSLKMQEHGK